MTPSSTTPAGAPEKRRSCRPSPPPRSAILPWPTRPASPSPAWRSPATRRRLQVHRQRQPGRRHHQRHRRPRPGQHRRRSPASRSWKARRVLFKRFADIDVFDLELDTRRPRRVHQRRQAARADLRRHQPRRHQSAGMLRDRGAAQGDDENPRLPRRPARHRHHLRRGAAERAGSGRQEASTR